MVLIPLPKIQKTLFPFSDLSSRGKPEKIVRAEKFSKTPTCLRTISCQAEKLHERKDAQRKPPLPHLTGS
jgi:hypothetical protein